MTLTESRAIVWPMFNLGFMEIVVVGVLALILIGPKQLPDMARLLGRMMNEFKKATSELSGGLLEDVKKDLRDPLRESINKINEEVNKVQSDLRNVVHYKPPERKSEPPADQSVAPTIVNPSEKVTDESDSSKS